MDERWMRGLTLRIKSQSAEPASIRINFREAYICQDICALDKELIGALCMCMLAYHI